MKLFGKEVSWKLLVVLAVLLSPFIYNLDAIQGRIKFEIMCRKEGGVRFYGHAERNSGWLVKGRTHGEDSSRAAVSEAFAFGDVLFVRYRDEKGKEVDVRVADPKGFGDKRFAFSEANPAWVPRYEYSVTYEGLAEDERFTKRHTTVTEIATSALLAEHTAFGYRWAKRERTILSAPTLSTCHWAGSSDQEFFRGIYGSREQK